MPDLIRYHLGNPTCSTTADPCRDAAALRYSPLFSSLWLGVAGSCKSGHLPIVEQEEEIGQRDRELEPSPVRKRVSQGGEDEESQGEGKLVNDAH